MNPYCTICSDPFGSSSEIYSAECGHIFHNACLNEWLMRSETCPQCRSPTTKECIYRVFINFTESDPSADMLCLKEELHTLKKSIEAKDKERQLYELKYKKIKQEKYNLSCEFKKLEESSKAREATLQTLKQHLLFLKRKTRDTKRMEDELKVLHRKINRFKQINLTVNGSREDVNEILRKNNDPYNLAMMVAALKRELSNKEKSTRLNSTQNIERRNRNNGFSSKFFSRRTHSSRTEETDDGRERRRQYFEIDLSQADCEKAGDISVVVKNNNQRKILEKTHLPEDIF